MISSAPAVVLQASLRFLRDNVYWLVKQLPPERERAVLSMLYGVGGETIGNCAHENHSQSDAAEALGISRAEVIELMGQHRIPIMRYGPGDFEQESKALNELQALRRGRTH